MTMPAMPLLFLDLFRQRSVLTNWTRVDRARPGSGLTRFSQQSISQFRPSMAMAVLCHRPGHPEQRTGAKKYHGIKITVQAPLRGPKC